MSIPVIIEWAGAWWLPYAFVAAGYFLPKAVRWSMRGTIVLLTAWSRRADDADLGDTPLRRSESIGRTRGQ